MQIHEGNILKSSFWPERVRVVSAKIIGESQIKVEAVGLETNRFYNPILSEEDIKSIEILEEKPFLFSADGEYLFLYLESHRIRNAFQFDPLYSVNVSMINPLPHQIDAVYHHILQNPRIRFLLADDPGAGKTIMAGLLLKELKYRGLVERTLVVGPGHLKDQWLREMKERFHEHFSIIDRNVMAVEWGKNVFNERNQVILSMDFAKQDDVMFALKDSKWDLCIVDKLSQIQDHLGSDRVFDVIGEVLVGKSLKDLIVDAIANRRTIEEILEDFERIPDEEAIRRVRETSLEALATRHIDLTRILGEQRRAIENRLVPEYVEEFFKRAAAMLKIRMEERGDGLWRIVSVPFEIRNQPYEFKIKFGEVQREYAKVSFDKEIAFKAQAEFVAMGHPLLEAVINSILTIYAQSAADGATFIDPEGRKGGIIWFLEIGEGLENYKKELLERRQRDADIKQKYGIRSLESMILDSDGKISEYETRRMKGENIPEATIQNEVRKKEDLERKKQRLQREIEAEVHLYPTDPGILGAVRVVPGKPHGDIVSDKEIEELGMDIAMAYESGHGMTPENVSTQNLGYDIRSQDDTENYRYIEVKARREK